MHSADVQHDLPAPSLGVMAAIIATVTVFALAQGLTYPLLSLLLTQQGIPAGLIGISASMTPLGFILSAPAIPILSQWLGLGRFALVSAVLAALAIWLIGLTGDVWAWMPLRFMLGFCANPLYVLSETWLVAITPAHKRGRVMGVYSSIVSAGFATGPLTLALVGTQGWAPFMVGIVAFILCGLIVLGVSGRLPDLPDDGENASVARFVRIAPLMIFGVFVAALFEQALLALFAVYGQSYGAGESRIAALMTAFLFGNVVLQVPLAAFAQKAGTRTAILVCSTLAAFGCALLPLVFQTWLIWPTLFVWGAVAWGIYTLTLMQLGERFSGRMLIAGNAAFSLAWGVGGIIGSPVAGAAMEIMGRQGLPLSIGLLCAVLAVAILLRRRAA